MSGIRVAYADPPYPGQARKHYRRHKDFAGEVDHRALIQYLEREFPDGWALSTSEPALRWLLPLTPEGTRSCPWVKPWCSFKRGVWPAHAHEYVLLCGGRRRDDLDRPPALREATPRDWVMCSATTRRGLAGVKPEAFCHWLFEILGLRPGDELVDLFPGSGAVTRAWEQWVREQARSNPLKRVITNKRHHNGRRSAGHRRH